MSEFEYEDEFEYLDELRESGDANMFEAAPYLQAVFDMDKKEARECLKQWKERVI